MMCDLAYFNNDFNILDNGTLLAIWEMGLEIEKR
jgi:hypothetical protein